MATKKRFVKWLWWTTLWVVWWMWKTAADLATLSYTLPAAAAAVPSDIATWRKNAAKILNAWNAVSNNIKSKIHNWLTSLALDEEDKKNIENWISWWEISANVVPIVLWVGWAAKWITKWLSKWLTKLASNPNNVKRAVTASAKNNVFVRQAQVPPFQRTRIWTLPENSSLYNKAAQSVDELIAQRNWFKNASQQSRMKKWLWKDIETNPFINRTTVESEAAARRLWRESADEAKRLTNWRDVPENISKKDFLDIVSKEQADIADDLWNQFMNW